MLDTDRAKCDVCDSFAPYTCMKCLGDFCGDHIDNHSEAQEILT